MNQTSENIIWLEKSIRAYKDYTEKLEKDLEQAKKNLEPTWIDITDNISVKLRPSGIIAVVEESTSRVLAYLTKDGTWFLDSTCKPQSYKVEYFDGPAFPNGNPARVRVYRRE